METKKVKVFKQSEIVDSILKSYKENPIKLENQEKEQFPMNETLLNKAIVRICESWNKDYKSRGFIKHLIGNFLPINQFAKILNFPEEEIKNNKDRDCIIGIKLAGLYPISKAMGEFSTTKLIASAAAITENKKELKPEDVKKLKDLKAKMPIEIRNVSFAYYSENSDKYLCRESMYALTLFVKQSLLMDEKEICFLLNKKRFNYVQQGFKKEKQLSNKQVNQVVKASTFGMDKIVDAETLEKLKNMHGDD